MIDLKYSLVQKLALIDDNLESAMTRCEEAMKCLLSPWKFVKFENAF